MVKAHGPGVRLDGSPYAHLMLKVLAIEGIVHEIRVGQDLGMMDLDVTARVQVILFILGDEVRHLRLFAMSPYQNEENSRRGEGGREESGKPIEEKCGRVRVLYPLTRMHPGGPESSGTGSPTSLT